MKIKHTYYSPGQSISYRPVELDDADRMFAWMSDPILRNNLGLHSKPTLERTRSWIIESSTNDTICALGILINGVHIGNVVLDRIDKALGTARLSIYIGPQEARSRGIGKFAISHALRTAFEALSLQKIWLTVHCKNAGAIHAYLILGFVIEGVLRREFLYEEHPADCFYMGLLREDFATSVSANLGLSQTPKDAI